jgi:hypothetical protein
MSDEPPVKRRGRPAIDEQRAPSVRIGVRVSPPTFDTLAAQARREQLSLSELLRKRFLSHKN